MPSIHPSIRRTATIHGVVLLLGYYHDFEVVFGIVLFLFYFFAMEIIRALHLSLWYVHIWQKGGFSNTGAVGLSYLHPSYICEG